MVKISKAVLHCSASPFGSAELIDRWHKQNNWRMIGYHFVILNGQYESQRYNPLYDGVVELGRKFDDDLWMEGDEKGAHALGYNAESVGICLISDGSGRDITQNQMLSLHKLLYQIMAHYDLTVDNIIGHYEVTTKKSCPGFDVGHLREQIRHGHVDTTVVPL